MPRQAAFALAVFTVLGWSAAQADPITIHDYAGGLGVGFGAFTAAAASDMRADTTVRFQKEAWAVVDAPVERDVDRVRRLGGGTPLELPEAGAEEHSILPAELVDVPDSGSSLCLMGVGLIGLWAWRKRWHQSRVHPAG